MELHPIPRDQWVVLITNDLFLQPPRKIRGENGENRPLRGLESRRQWIKTKQLMFPDFKT